MVEKFEYKDHRIIQGDSSEILSSEVADNSGDLIFVDPYNIDKNFNGRKDKRATEEDCPNCRHQWIDLYVNRLKSNGSMNVVTSVLFEKSLLENGNHI